MGRAPGVSSHALRRAVFALRHGGLVAYPTEAVYGLGCDPLDGQAVLRLLALKRRALAKGLILIAADWSQLRPFVRTLDTVRMVEIQASWPGPHTWLLPARATTPSWLTGRHDTLAVRVTAHPIAAGLCRAFGGAIVSTSANRAGRQPARSARAVGPALGALSHSRRLGAGALVLLPGRCGPQSNPSTIRDGCSGMLLRG